MLLFPGLITVLRARQPFHRSAGRMAKYQVIIQIPITEKLFHSVNLLFFSPIAFELRLTARRFFSRWFWFSVFSKQVKFAYLTEFSKRHGKCPCYQAPPLHLCLLSEALYLQKMEASFSLRLSSDISMQSQVSPSISPIRRERAKDKLITNARISSSHTSRACISVSAVQISRF